MTISPMAFLRHEIIGLSASVFHSRDATLISRSGTVVAETRDMLQLETDNRSIFVAKDLCVFDFTLPDGTMIRVDGELLCGRTEDRLKKHQGRRW